MSAWENPRSHGEAAAMSVVRSLLWIGALIVGGFIVAFVAAFLFFSLASGAAQAQTTARVYGMRGLLGSVYSRGIDTALAKASAEIPNIKTYIKPHYRWREFAATAAANYKIRKHAIVLIGHSLGADATVSIANRLLAEGIPVEVILAYDPTPRIGCIPANVHKGVDFYNSGLGLGGGDIEPCQGFNGVIENNYKYINHVVLDDDPDVHIATLCEIRHAIARAAPGVCDMPAGWAKGIKRRAAPMPRERPAVRQ